MSSHTDTLERQHAAMRDALRSIVHRLGDCDYVGNEHEKPTVCDCAVCTARRALATETDWRFMGALHDRLERSPREDAIVRAWMKYLKGSTEPRSMDAKLARILNQDGTPTIRDWYVATTIVQWLATNVGSCLLEEAGFRYQPPKEKP